MNHESVDITIIGGGPTGLFALFYAGMRGVRARIVDALPEIGGQLTALYPEKYIFDVGGYRQILAKNLVRELADQAFQFGAPVHLNLNVTALEEENGSLVLATETDRFPTRAVVIAGGLGAFSPRRLPQKGTDEWYGRGVYDRVVDPTQFQSQKIVIIGGGDSAFDWAHQLRDVATEITLVHRSDRYRAHAATVAEVRAAAPPTGRTTLLPFHELQEILAEGDTLRGVRVRDVKEKTTRDIEADAVLPMLGFHSELGTLKEWGLTFEGQDIVVNSQMETGRRGVWAAGDITTYPGKLKLIATGFGEAAAAVNQAVHWIYPEKKVAPGHSSNMAIFGQKDD